MNPAEHPSRPPLWRRMLVPGLLVLAIGLIGLGLPLAWVGLRGKSAWEKTQDELRARGEKLTLAELAPAAPPIERNFFADPMWRELSDVIVTTTPDGRVSRTPRVPEGARILDALKAPVSEATLTQAKAILPPGESSILESAPNEADLSNTVANLLVKTSDASRRKALAGLLIATHSGSEPLRERVRALLRERPDAAFPLDYAATSWPDFPHFQYLFPLVKAFRDLANAHLALDDRAAASADTVALYQLAGTLRSEPTLISLLVRMSFVDFANIVVQRGIEQHLWNAEDLGRFDRELAKVDFVAGLALALRGERGGFNQILNHVRKSKSPASLAALTGVGPGRPGPAPAAEMIFAALYPFTADTDQEYYNRELQVLIDALSDPAGIHPGTFPKAAPPAGFLFRASHFLSALGTVNFDSVILKALYLQDSVRQLRVACALERYRLAHRAYPDSLSALDFPTPASVIAGSPMRYLRTPDGEFLLWSPGWNETDEGGSFSPTRSDYRSADWVWGSHPGATPAPR